MPKIFRQHGKSFLRTLISNFRSLSWKMRRAEKKTPGVWHRRVRARIDAECAAEVKSYIFDIFKKSQVRADKSGRFKREWVVERKNRYVIIWVAVGTYFLSSSASEAPSSASEAPSSASEAPSPASEAPSSQSKAPSLTSESLSCQRRRLPRQSALHSFTFVWQIAGALAAKGRVTLEPSLLGCAGAWDVGDGDWNLDRHNKFSVRVFCHLIRLLGDR